MAKTLKQTVAFLIIFCMLFGAVPLYAAAESDISVVITKTDIKADEVFNTNGYGSLQRKGEPDDGMDEDFYFRPQAALADRNGKLLFPYKETYSRYYYGNGIVSLVGESPYEYVRDRERNPEKPQFFDLDGNEAFSCSGIGATPMIDGYSFVVDGWVKGFGLRCYLINRTGQTVYTFMGDFTTTTAFWDGFSTGYGALAEAGWYSDGLLLCWQYPTKDDASRGLNAKIFYMNEKGETVLTLPEEYPAASSFSEGFARIARIETDGEYIFGSDAGFVCGYVNKAGEIVIPPQFDHDSNGWFKDGLCHAKKNGKWGYIDTTGKTVIPFEYDDARGAGDGLASVAKDGKYGLVDYQNNVVVPLEYDKISCFVGGTAYAIKDGTLYIITGCQQEISDTIDSETAKEKEGSLFTAPGMTAKELTALAGDGATVTKADGTALTEKDIVGSGMTLKKPDGTKLTVVVKGDNNGDGKVEPADARLALRRSVALEKFTDWQTAASLVNNGDSKEVTPADARLILRASVGLEKLPLA